MSRRSRSQCTRSSQLRTHMMRSQQSSRRTSSSRHRHRAISRIQRRTRQFLKAGSLRIRTRLTSNRRTRHSPKLTHHKRRTIRYLVSLSTRHLSLIFHHSVRQLTTNGVIKSSLGRIRIKSRFVRRTLRHSRHPTSHHRHTQRLSTIPLNRQHRQHRRHHCIRITRICHTRLLSSRIRINRRHKMVLEVKLNTHRARRAIHRHNKVLFNSNRSRLPRRTTNLTIRPPNRTRVSGRSLTAKSSSITKIQVHVRRAIIRRLHHVIISRLNTSFLRIVPNFSRLVNVKSNSTLSMVRSSRILNTRVRMQFQTIRVPVNFTRTLRLTRIAHLRRGVHLEFRHVPRFLSRTTGVRRLHAKRRLHNDPNSQARSKRVRHRSLTRTEPLRLRNSIFTNSRHNTVRLHRKYKARQHQVSTNRRLTCKTTVFLHRHISSSLVQRQINVNTRLHRLITRQLQRGLQPRKRCLPSLSRYKTRYLRRRPRLRQDRTTRRIRLIHGTRSLSRTLSFPTPHRIVSTKRNITVVIRRPSNKEPIPFTTFTNASHRSAIFHQAIQPQYKFPPFQVVP